MAALEILFFVLLFVCVGGVYLRHRWRRWQLAKWEVKRAFHDHGHVDVEIHKGGQREHIATILLEGNDLSQFWEDISQAESQAFERASALTILDKANRRK